jgi:hypothetical protein
VIEDHNQILFEKQNNLPINFASSLGKVIRFPSIPEGVRETLPRSKKEIQKIGNMWNKLCLF